jgi:hypothetical protein
VRVARQCEVLVRRAARRGVEGHRKRRNQSANAIDCYSIPKCQGLKSNSMTAFFPM